MTDLLIRDAREDDLPGILAIYNDAVVNTTAIWNDDLVDLADRRRWFEGRRVAGFPVIVAEDPSAPDTAVGGTIAGYASFGPFRAFSGYRHTAELSVYVAPGRRGRGIGDRLLGDLVHRARLAGLHVLVAGITGGNEASLKLHARHGFEQSGYMRQVGNKFGDWLDLVFMQRLL